MRRALALAARGWGRVAPNPLVGAVVVRDGEVVGEGHHSEYGQAHAEVEALRAAGARARGATLYVTLEPCAHTGKTPPCTMAVAQAGVRRLVYACSDPNPRATGGAESLRRQGVEVVGGVCEAEARDLNASFLHAHSAAGEARPWLSLKLALSLDGRIADLHGRSAWITGEEAREEVHRLRAGFDAVAVGVGTALADDPRLTVRGTVVPRVPPVRIVFDRQLRLPVNSRLVRSAREHPVWIACSPEAEPARRAVLESAGVRVLSARTVQGMLRELRDHGIGSVFCEGGAVFAGSLLREGLVDRMHLFYAPLFLGPKAASPFAALESPAIEESERWRSLGSRTFGADTLITLARR